jgi:hypothetical protein
VTSGEKTQEEAEAEAEVEAKAGTAQGVKINCVKSKLTERYNRSSREEEYHWVSLGERQRHPLLSLCLKTNSDPICSSICCLLFSSSMTSLNRDRENQGPVREGRPGPVCTEQQQGHTTHDNRNVRDTHEEGGANMRRVGSRGKERAANSRKVGGEREGGEAIT